MFEGFFHQLRGHGLPVSPKSFMKLQHALDVGLVEDLEDFYAVARALLVKSERHFDLYDRIFATYFEGKEFEDPSEALTDDIKRILAEWLGDPSFMEGLPEDEREALAGMTPDEVVQYFMDRLKDQTEAEVPQTVLAIQSAWPGTVGLTEMTMWPPELSGMQATSLMPGMPLWSSAFHTTVDFTKAPITCDSLTGWPSIDPWKMGSFR